MHRILDYAEEILQKPIVAAATGSLIAVGIAYRQSRAAGKQTDWLMLALSLMTGLSASQYLAPWFAAMIGAEKFGGGVSFLVGFLAMNVAQAVWEFVKNGDLRGVILSWLTRGQP